MTLRAEEIDSMKISLSNTPDKDKLEKEVQAEKIAYQRKVFGLDLCFLMDCTGSMGAWIAQAKEKVCAIMESAMKIDKRVFPRVAFVGYRDICDGSQRLFIVDFTEAGKVSIVQNEVQNVLL